MKNKLCEKLSILSNKKKIKNYSPFGCLFFLPCLVILTSFAMRQTLKKVFQLLLLLGAVFCSNKAISQDGNPFLSHFRLPSGVSNQNWGFEQGSNGQMFILNRKGIYTFDGLQWENLGVSGRPIAIAYTNQLFYCSDKGVGYFQQNDNGTYSQEILLESTGSNLFYKISKIEEGLLVVSPQTICQITIGDGIKVDTLYHEVRQEVFISDFFRLKGQMYHVKNRALIYLNKPDGKYEMLAGLPIGEDMIFSFIHGDIAVFGSSTNRLYKFDGRRLTPFALKEQSYINLSLLTGGISIDESSFALSTLNGGCIIVNSSNGATITTINFFNGLPDDEVYSLGKDSKGGLWVSHGMGITRVDLKLPVRSFNHYPGLRGNILSSIEHNGKLFVGCSEGLYLLSEVRDYRSVEVVDKPAPSQKSTQPEVSRDNQDQKQHTVEEKKKGFLNKLFSRRDSKASDEDVAIKVASDAPKTLEEKDLSPTKRKIYQLQSVSHSYKQITGVTGKVRILFDYKGSLFAATNFGLFEIIGERVNPIVRGKNITFAEPSSFIDNTLLVGTDGGAYLAVKKGNAWVLSALFEGDNEQIISIAEANKEKILVASEFDVILVNQVEKKYTTTILKVEGTEFGSPLVRRINGEAFAFTSAGSFLFNAENDEFKPDVSLGYIGSTLIAFHQAGYTWMKGNAGWVCYNSEPDKPTFSAGILNLLDDPKSIYVSSKGKILAVNRYTQLYSISEKIDQKTEKELDVLLKKVLEKSGALLEPKNIKLSYSNNSLAVNISAPSYLKEGSVQFQYIIKGLMIDWSEWTNNPVLEFPYLPSGKHTINIRARDVLGNQSQTLDIPIHIRPPFWKTVWFIALCLVALVVFFIQVVKIRERNLIKEKEILEQKVRERTKTIEEQKEVLKQQRDDLAKYNEEILQQKEEIETQRDEIEAQRDQIFKQNDEITKSITYARRIQSAVMPSREMISCLLDNHFLLFRPRDIVSGDFYWMTEKNGKVVVVAADCTGHGVPGAFMSMMGVSFLNDIVNVAGVTQPDLMLNELREKIKTTLWQTGKEGEARDGMDIAVCVFDKNLKKVQFAGAYNPLYIIRDGEIIEIKADKMPVGIHVKEKDSFTIHEIELAKGDSLYIFSDGYVSQFGGPEGKKFMAKPFKELLASLYGKPMSTQLKALEDALDIWQGAHDQVDDVLVIGITI